MIGYLQGEVLEHTEGKMLVGVGERARLGMVGYSVSVPQSAEYGAFLAGQKIELFVYAHIREDTFDLYGFCSKFEKDLFLTLLGVNGIGPKSALGILSAAESSQLLSAIMNGDQAFLTRMPGVGKKTAERLVVELRDTVRKKVEAGLFSIHSEGDSQGKPNEILRSGKRGMMESPIFKDAKDALISLGYREQEIYQILNRVLEAQDFRPQRAEELVRTALRQLSHN